MTTIQAISCKKATQAIGPYSQATCYGNMIFSSGQLGIDPKTGALVSPSVKDQTHQIFKNLKELLDSSNSDLSKIIKVTIFITNMENFSKIIALRKKYFSPPYPADTIVEVSSLALPELEIEIEAIALVDGEIIG